MQLNASDSAYWSRPVLVAGAAEREIKMESARQYPWKISISRSWDSDAFLVDTSGNQVEQAKSGIHLFVLAML